MGRSPSMPNMKILDTARDFAKPVRPLEPLPPAMPARHTAMPIPVPLQHTEASPTGAELDLPHDNTGLGSQV